MPDFLQFQVDKFVFKVSSDRYYSNEGIWVKKEDKYVRIGISDYLQQRSGDIAFVETKPAGTKIKMNDELAVIETIKVNISLLSPLPGRVMEVNPALETVPDIINQDPYGKGWLVVLDVEKGEDDMRYLLNPQGYFTKIRLEAEREVRGE